MLGAVPKQACACVPMVSSAPSQLGLPQEEVVGDTTTFAEGCVRWAWNCPQGDGCLPAKICPQGDGSWRCTLGSGGCLNNLLWLRELVPGSQRSGRTPCKGSILARVQLLRQQCCERYGLRTASGHCSGLEALGASLQIFDQGAQDGQICGRPGSRLMARPEGFGCKLTKEANTLVERSVEIARSS